MLRSLLLISSLLLSLAASAQKPFVIGETVEIASARLGERRSLHIYLPQNYRQDDTSRYRVLYLLDGSAHEDFPHIAGLVQFFEMMELMPPTIVVGIANVDRKRDFTFPVAKATKEAPPSTTGLPGDFAAFAYQQMRNPKAGHSDKFIGFIESELQPYISTHYRTRHRSLIGQSLGGLLATEILAKKPGLFDDYIIVSPSLWWDHQSLLRAIDPSKLNGKTVYIAVGKEGDVMERDAAQLAEQLQANPSARVLFRPMERETHATILHNAVYEAFRTLYCPNYLGEPH